MTNKKRLKKRRPFWLFLILIVLVCWFFWQQESIAVETYTISDSRLPTAFDGLRIAHLSDLHGKEFGEGSSRLLEEVAALQPDLIALTGDFIDQTAQVEMLPSLLEGLSRIAPTYFVTGNHDWAAADSISDFKDLLTEHGVTVLSGEYVPLEYNGASIVLAGLDDPNGLAEQTTGAELRAEIAKEFGEETYSILLSHRDSLEDYSSWGFHLTLCGHGHGGIFRIPLLDKGLLGTDRSFFPDYDGGLFQLGGNSYVISRGLGSNTVPIRAFRLFNRPHLPLVILTRGD